jgi:RNA polymerase sigma factor (sigma-70 family)
VDVYNRLPWGVLLDALHPPEDMGQTPPLLPDGRPVERDPAWLEAHRRLLAYARRILLRRKDPALEADELARAVLIKLAEPGEGARKIRAHLRKAASAEAYLIRMVRNAAYDEERRRRHRAHRPLAAEPPNPPPPFSAEEAEWLRAGLAKLPVQERTLLIEKLWEGRSIAELAAAHGTRYSAMAVRLTRILEKLRRLLAD